MKIKHLLIAPIIVLQFACNTSKISSTSKTQKNSKSENATLYDSSYSSDLLNYHKDKQINYQSSETRINDIIHTKLDVTFDFKNHYLHGKANISLKPYFYSTSSLSLDAKGFDIHKVQIVKDGKNLDLKFTYDSLDIFITLDKEYKRTEIYNIYIEYTAKPDNLTLGGSSAISGDKGLYFINTDSSEKNKPTQAWTQGETEASSCWFPTIDRPNEKMTHEIFMTFPEAFKSLSNGLMVSTKNNNNGTRTDHWKMSLPHAPYLVMMAVGPFSIVKDTWKKANGREMEVNYYVEPEFEKYAKDIFGETPRMIQFFSERLGVEYPWEKYSQVVVRDYVSGAMENTTATIHGEFLQRTKREMLDGDNESIIAHELFHHWFGDYVTCESWSNLPLNESFANYSQYLWDEFKYGADEADHNAYSEAQGYFMQNMQQGYRHMVRFDYGDKEEMFDGNSYNKGGRILHMLRNVVGDDAFFESLRVYLTDNQFQPAEIHHLRLAFEKVTGRDLNWFFNQWFLNKGHPIIEYTQSYANDKLTLRVRQKQDKSQSPLYIIPIKVDVYTSTGVQTFSIEIREADSTYSFNLSEAPIWVNPDADKVTLCEKDDIKPAAQWISQYNQGKNFIDRFEAIKECATMNSPEAQEVLINGLSDKFWYMREVAVKNLKKVVKSNPDLVKTKLIEMAANDPRPSVRSSVIRNLNKYFKDDNSLVAVYQKAADDSSYDVMSEAFVALAKSDAKIGLALARKHENEKSGAVREAIAQIYADHGVASDHAFFKKAIEIGSGFEKYSLMIFYGNFLKRVGYEETYDGLSIIKTVATGDGGWFVRLSGYQAFNNLKTHYEKKALEAQTLSESLKMEGKTMEAIEADREMVKAKGLADKINSIVEELKLNETDKNVLKYIH